MTPSFWKNRRVLLTGHTGFKGAWVAALLAGWGAKVTGAALAPETDPNLWSLIKDRVAIDEFTADLRDLGQVALVCRSAKPEIVLHMAAQAQVRSSYLDPVGTFASNVIGTANLLETLRGIDGVKAILVVTSDKVYANAEDGTVFDETSALGGGDPYSASKAATELVAKSYANSYFIPRGVAIATARGGNVVGGGDFSSDRLVPDLYRAAKASVPVELRYPNAHRPWQHVLDCLSGYLAFLEFIFAKQVANPSALNFGPLSEEIFTVASMADAIGRRLGNSHSWKQAEGSFPAEKQALRLTPGLACKTLGWRPRLDMTSTVEWTADWYARFAKGEDAFLLMQHQIMNFQSKS
jgi:CDP-glucose 4,6-dehydratase